MNCFLQLIFHQSNLSHTVRIPTRFFAHLIRTNLNLTLRSHRMPSYSQNKRVGSFEFFLTFISKNRALPKNVSRVKKLKSDPISKLHVFDKKNLEKSEILQFFEVVWIKLFLEAINFALRFSV
jgi:hypothetical protein